MDTARPPQKHLTPHHLFELVSETAAGILAGVSGGVDRIELCSALAIGGVTPSVGLMQLAADCGVP